MIQRLTSRTLNFLRAFRRDRTGALAIMVVLLVPVLVGMMGLTVDVGIWYSHKRAMQDAVDAAAIAAGNEIANGGTDSAATTAAEADADRNGFVDTTDAITVNLPPLSGPNTGVDGAVEVIITRTLPLFFTTLFLDEPYTALVRAVVLTGFFEEGFCILGLDDSASKAVSVEGTGTVTLDCGIAVNSSADNAFNVQGTASVIATDVSTVGKTAIIGGADLDLVSGLPRRGPKTEDPYKDVEVPAFSGCDATNTSVNDTQTFDAADGSNAGIFVMCGGFKAVAGADVTFEPGVYIMDKGDFEIAGGSTIEGEDVTFILTSSGNDNQIGKVKITGGSDITLDAPDSGDFAGLIFFQDRNVSSNPSKSNLIAGGAELKLGGALYFPEQTLRFAGGSELGDNCTQLIGKKVTVNGDTGIQVECGGGSNGTSVIGRVKGTLAE